MIHTLTVLIILFLALLSGVGALSAQFSMRRADYEWKRRAAHNRRDKAITTAAVLGILAAMTWLGGVLLA